MKKILITGGQGYIGGRLTHFLAQLPETQVVVTSRGKKNLFTNEKNIQVISWSIGEKGLEKILSEVDTVIHLAALNEVDCALHPQKAVETNTLGTFELLQSCIEQKVQRFIYMSTAHVYGAPLEGELDENSPTHPIHPYAYSHRAAEDYVYSAHAQKKIQGISLRLSNSFGAPLEAGVDRWTLLVNDLARKVVNSKKLVLNSSGLQQRDFITLNDACRAVSHCIHLDEAKLGNGIFNVGRGESMSVIAMTELIGTCCQKVFGFDPVIEKMPIGKNERPLPLAFKVNKLQATGFTLENRFEEEISQLLLFCQQNF